MKNEIWDHASPPYHLFGQHVQGEVSLDDPGPGQLLHRPHTVRGGACRHILSVLGILGSPELLQPLSLQQARQLQERNLHTSYSWCRVRSRSRIRSRSGAISNGKAYENSQLKKEKLQHR